MIIQRSKAMRFLLSRFARGSSGAAAVEFAFIFPVLALIIVALPDVGNAAVGDVNMDTAVRAGVQYAMNGSQDLTAIKNVALQSWSSRPSGSTLSTAQVCQCGSGSATCGSTCADGSLAATYVTITATATLGGLMYSFPKTTTQTIRIQ